MGTLFSIIDPIEYFMTMTTNMLVVLYYLFAIGNWAIVLLCLYFMYLTIIKVGAPMIIFEKQSNKIGSYIWTPVHSYFYEAMRGKSIIRAFQQEKKITAK